MSHEQLVKTCNSSKILTMLWSTCSCYWRNVAFIFRLVPRCPIKCRVMIENANKCFYSRFISSGNGFRKTDIEPCWNIRRNETKYNLIWLRIPDTDCYTSIRYSLVFHTEVRALPSNGTTSSWLTLGETVNNTRRYILSLLPVSQYFSHNSSFSDHLLVEISVQTTDRPRMQEINTSLFKARLHDISNVHNTSHFKARILKTTTESALQACTS
jgi:hypothetical protein